MGFMWSSPKTPLTERLIQNVQYEPVRNGDLILVGEYAEDMCMEDFSPWTNVGIVFSKNRIFDGLNVSNIPTFIQNQNEVKIRYYEGIRHYGFDKRLNNAVKQSCYNSQRLSDPDTDASYGVAHVLFLLHLIDTDDIWDVYPVHFSSSLAGNLAGSSPFKKLQLQQYYSNNKDL